MRRRDLLKALPALAAIPRLHGARIRITNLRNVPLKTAKDLGSIQIGSKTRGHLHWWRRVPRSPVPTRASPASARPWTSPILPAVKNR